MIYLIESLIIKSTSIDIIYLIVTNVSDIPFEA